MKNCEEIQELLSEYIDDYLDIEKRKEVEEHLHKCPICQREFEALKQTVNMFSIIGEEELIPPASFRRELRQKIEKKNILLDKFKGFFNKYSFKVWVPLVTAVFLIFIILPVVFNFPGGMKSDKSAQLADDASFKAGQYEIAGNNKAKLKMSENNLDGRNFKIQEETALDTTSDQIQFNRKIIKTGNIYLEVEDYKHIVSQIQQLVLDIGGYVVSENTYVYDNERQLLQGNLVIRIPAEKFDQALEHFEKMGKSKNRTVNASDVTEEYVDVESRLKAMKLKEERLLALLNKSGSLKDILAVENELARTRGEIEALEGRLRYLNNRIELSTINISIKEVLSSVKTIKTTGLEGVFLRTKEAFIQAINSIIIGTGNLIVFVGGKIPYIVLIGIGIIIIWYLIKKFLTGYSKE